MKTKDIPAMVMLLAGGIYCLNGIRYQIPLMDFLVQLFIVLMLFWVIGGIVRMVLDRFMGEIEDKTAAKEENDEEADETDVKEADEEESEAEQTSETEEEE